MSGNRVHDCHVRPYRREDRGFVRLLVLDCADPGIVPACLKNHVSAFSDLLSRYYLDHEPESCWVVESPVDGVVGYVFGCVSSRRRRTAMFVRIVPSALARMFLGGALIACPVIRLIRAGLATWLRGRSIKRRTQRRFPGHLHVGLHPRYRGIGLGSQLVRQFLQHATQAGVAGVHVSVVKTNTQAQQFFAGLGFGSLGQYNAFFPGSWSRVDMLLLGAITCDAPDRRPASGAMTCLARVRHRLARARRWRRLRLPFKAFDSLISVLWGIPLYLQTPFLWFVSVEPPVIPEPVDAVHDRILVIAPHPDDDILGVGGTLADAQASGASVLAVYLTSGDANRAAKHLMTLHPFRLAAGYRSLGGRREREAVLALRQLGIPAEHAVFLNYPDRGLSPMLDHHPAPCDAYRSRFTDRSATYSDGAFRPSVPYCGDALIEDLCSIVVRFRPTVIYVPHPQDAHPDHRAGYRAVHAAWQRASESCPDAPQPDIRCYLVHVFEERWPLPGGRRAAMPLSLVPASMAHESWVSTPLSDDAINAKLAAIRSHASQWLTSRRFLAGFVRTNEIYAHSLPRDGLSVAGSRTSSSRRDRRT